MKNFRLDDESGHQEALFSWAGYNMGRMPEALYFLVYVSFSCFSSLSSVCA